MNIETINISERQDGTLEKQWSGLDIDGPVEYETTAPLKSCGGSLAKSRQDSDNVSTYSTMSIDTQSSNTSSLSEATSAVFAFEGLQGRVRECQILKESIKKVGTSPQVALISGPAGCGKTALTNWFREEATSNGAAFFSGEHALSQQDEPYAAFTEIGSKICQDMVSWTDTQSVVSDWNSDTMSALELSTEAEDVTMELKSRLGSQARTLIRLVPGFKAILSDKTNMDDAETETGLRLDEKYQLHIAFRTLFRVLCEFRRHVLVVENLHWADEASVDLLKFIVADKECKGLMIVGCFRDDEVASTPFSSALETIKNSSDTDNVDVKHIEVSNLDVKTIDDIIKSLLKGRPYDDTHPMAEFVHSRTLGNAFFSLQLLRSLKEEDLIAFKDGRFTWDLDQVRQKASATKDAIELMQMKIDKLPENVKHLLHLASTLGATVSLDLFELIVEDFYSDMKEYKRTGLAFKSSDDSQKRLKPEALLSSLVKKGLMYKSKKGAYCWEHDKIREAAAISSSTNKAEVHLRVGELLLGTLDDDKLEKYLFTVVRLLNDGSSSIRSSDAHKRIILAELNLRAGKKSLQKSGFHAARAYLNKGIDMLPPNHSRVHMNLSLDLYSSAAEAEYCVGDFAMMEKHCRDVISKPFIQLEEKRRAYTSLVLGLNGQGRSSEAFDLGTELLAKLNCILPKRFLGTKISAGIRQMKTIAKSGLAETLRKPPITDPAKLWALDIMADLFIVAYVADMSELMTIVAFQSFQWTVQYGPSPKTSLFLAQVSIIAMSMGEFTLGSIYADQALSLLEGYSDDRLICDVTIQTFALAWHWSHDIDTDRLYQGYLAGLSAGAVENASWCINNCLEQKLFTGGAPLELLRADTAKYADQMKTFNVQLPYECTLFLVQAVSNLMGQSTHTSRLSGSAMNEDDKIREYKETENALCLAVMNPIQFLLAFFFDDFERTMELRKEYSEASIEATCPALFGLCVINYCNSMAAISMFRKTNKRSHLRIAKVLAKKVQGWNDAGNPNVLHYDTMLQAEFADLNSKPIEARKHFTCAIAIAEKREQVSDCAKAEQRLAEFELRQGNKGEAAHHMQRSIHVFEEWGATAVSLKLRNEYPQLICALPSSMTVDSNTNDIEDDVSAN